MSFESFVLSFGLPGYSGDLLLEDYVVQLMQIIAVAYISGALWWISYRMRWKSDALSPVVARLAALVIAVPYVLYAVAQTSRFHDAVASGNASEAENSLKPWKNIEGRNKAGDAPMTIAAKRGDLDMIRFLICKGAYVYSEWPRRPTIDHLNLAVKLGHREIALIMLDKPHVLITSDTVNIANSRSDYELVNRMYLMDARLRPRP